MADPDLPFRRPREVPTDGDVADASPTGDHQVVVAGFPEESLILDPAFHQSVWKPWQEATTTVALTPATTPGGAARRRIMLAAALMMVFALVVALVLPRLVEERTWRFQPLVQDMAGRPDIAWSSEEGYPCFNPPDQDQAVLSNGNRVWSLDLDSGTTLWSVEPGELGRITCLPVPDLVAVAVMDPVDNSMTETLFLDASTGAEVADLPGDSTRQVLPLGPRIGLLDATNKLRAVDPGALERPVWSQQLQVPSGDMEDIYVLDVYDTVVQLVYYVNGPEGSSTSFTRLLSTADGESPAWAPNSSSTHASSTRFGDVIAQYEVGGGGPSVSLLDLQGRELWSLGEDQLGIAGSRFYIATPASSDSATGFTDLREVDPRTGEAVRGDSYQGLFDYTIAAGDHIAVLRGQTLHILDDDLQEQPAIAVPDFTGVYEGEELVYVESSPDRNGTQGSRLTAIDVEKTSISWTIDLEPGQSVAQLGRHLVVVGADETFHGLMSSS